MDFDRYVFFFSFIFFLVINRRVIFSVFIRINSKLMGSLKKIISVVNFWFFERREVVLLYVIVVVGVLGVEISLFLFIVVFGFWVFGEVGVVVFGIVGVVIVGGIVVVDVDVDEDFDVVDEGVVVVNVVVVVIIIDLVILLFFVVLVVVILFIVVVVVLFRIFVVLYKNCVINSVKRGMSKVVI